jgi:hypothetical protein
MFYKTGVDITNDKQMFNFLKNHFEYPTMNFWNHLESIANNVKLYNLGLSGDWCTALNLLENGEYDTINCMIHQWCLDHPGYGICFNGRSGGYLVLMNTESNQHVLPEEIVEAEDYNEYKRFCKEFYGSVRANRDDLVFYTKLVQDFDKLCDELRDYCDELSNLKFEVIEMEKAVECFNEKYEDDLELLGFRKLRCDENGRVNVEEIATLASLFEAFMRIVDRHESGYNIKSDESGWLSYVPA